MTPAPTTRRRFIALSSVAASTGFAGCSRIRDSLDDSNPSNTSNSTEDEPDVENNDENETEPSDEERTKEEPDDNELELTLETEFRSREKYRQPGESFDSFNDVSSWNVVSGSMEADEDVFFEGSQSARLYTDTGENIVIRRELDESVDLTDRDISFAVRTTTPGNVAVYVQFVDVLGTSRIHQLRSITYRTSDVGWFRSCPGVFEDSELDIQMDNLARVDLVVNNTAPEAEVWIDDMRTHTKPEKGYVVLLWDDGHRDFYETATPLHDEYGINAVQSVVRQWTMNAREDVMTRPELIERQDAGDQIIAHGTHQAFAEYDPEDLRNSLERDKEWAVNNGFEGGHFITYPHNSFDATVLDVVGDYYYAGGFNQSGDVNLTGVHGFDPLVLPRTIGHDLDRAKRCVDLAAEHNNCTILNFHAFDQENTMPVDDYEALLEHIVSKGDDIEAITFDELWQMRMDEH